MGDTQREKERGRESVECFTLYALDPPTTVLWYLSKKTSTERNSIYFKAADFFFLLCVCSCFVCSLPFQKTSEQEPSQETDSEGGTAAPLDHAKHGQ